MTKAPRTAALFLAALFALLASGVPPLSAQQALPAEPAAQAQALPRAEAEKLIETLEDPERRQELVARLKALAALEQEGVPSEEEEALASSLLQSMSDAVAVLSARLLDTLEALKRVPERLIEGVGRLGDPVVRSLLLEVLAKLLLVFGLALLGEYLVKRLLARGRKSLDGRSGEGQAARIFFLLLRLVLDLVPIAAFAAIAYGVLPFTEPREATRVVALVLINANLLSRAMALLGRAVFAPEAENLRVLPLSDEGAHYGYLWLRRLSVVGIYGFVTAEAILLLGLGTTLAALLSDLVGLLLLGMAILLLLQLRAPVAERLKGTASPQGVMGSLRLRLAEIWHVLAVLYLLGIFFVWLMEISGGFYFLARASLFTLVIFAAARLAGYLIDRGLEKGFRLRSDIALRYPLLEARANRYLPVLGRTLRGVAYLLAFLLVLQVWGLNIFGWFEGPAGKLLLGRILGIAFILLGAFILWEVVNALIESYLRRQATNGLERNARMETLLGLFQNALRVVLAVMVTLVVLSELGLDIAPLLAGAGVVGLAIGFGAQTLVKDVITGIFLLIEDVIAVGDVVELAGHSGLVERITIRTVHLRDLEGSVHTLPFSEVTTIKNFGRGFSFALLDVGVAYRENTDDVVEVLREVARDMREDEAFRDVILEELEVLGVDSFGDSAVVVRVRLKTKPLSQWSVKREFNRRMKHAFDARGIEIPFPHITLYMGEDKSGAAPPLRLKDVTRESAEEEADAWDTPPAAGREPPLRPREQPEEGKQPDEGKRGPDVPSRREARRPDTPHLPDPEGEERS